jgi:hypothetical protein
MLWSRHCAMTCMYLGFFRFEGAELDRYRPLHDGSEDSCSLPAVKPVLKSLSVLLET